MPPGGAADAYARLLQRHLSAHLPGAPPSIIVENVPGAGTAKSVAYMETLPPDGTAIVTFSSGLLTEAITAPERVRIDFRTEGFIGNVSEDTRVCYLWHTSGVRDWQELLAREQVVFSASAPGTAGYVDAAMLRELFGVPLKQVDGYPGSAEMRLAVEKGEVDGDCGGWTSMPEDWLRAAKVNVVVRLSPTLLPGMDKSVPFAGDLVKTRARAGDLQLSDGCAGKTRPRRSWSRAACRRSALPFCAAPSTPRSPIRRSFKMPKSSASR